MNSLEGFASWSMYSSLIVRFDFCLINFENKNMSKFNDRVSLKEERVIFKTSVSSKVEVGYEK